jgi:tRNA threonylcarbamoyladenosine biosynthesis protein TsaB
VADVLVLGIDTATTQVSVALGDAAEVRGEIRLGGGRRHAEQLAPAIEYLCRESRIELAQLSALAVGIGPGLFTGLRVGVTTAKVMAQALHVPVVAIPSLDLVAYPLRHAARTLVVVSDARRREVFWARYRTVPGGVQRVGDYNVTAPAELAADLEATDEEVLLVGDGVARYTEVFAGIDHAELAGPEHTWPSAGALVELAARRVEREEFCAPGDVEPMYLRRSDAEIEWDRRGMP